MAEHRAPFGKVLDHDMACTKQHIIDETKRSADLNDARPRCKAARTHDRHRRIGLGKPFGAVLTTVQLPRPARAAALVTFIGMQRGQMQRQR